MTDLSSLAPEKPAYLYKYCSAARAVQILDDLYVYLAPVERLNDTFEFAFLGLLTEDDNTPRVYLTKQLVARGLELQDAREMAAVIDEVETRSAYEQWKREILVPVLARIRKHSGVTCFSAEEDNQRMWATYADDHRGVCIEFAVGAEACPFEGWLFPVVYSSAKTGLSVADLVNDDMSLSWEVLAFLSSIKHGHWRDEKEWRVLFLDKEERGGDSRKLPLSSASISRVFLGPRISRSDETSVRSVVEEKSLDAPVFRRAVDGLFGRAAWDGVEMGSSAEDAIYWLKRLNPGHRDRIESLFPRNRRPKEDP